jgi:hypothetical protein
MASYLLYIVTGAVLALMAARHFLAHASPRRRAQALDLFAALPHPQDEAMHWPEAAVCAAILLFGLWLAFAGALQALSLLLHLS